MGYSKIDYYGKTLIDLTEDTISPDKVLAGATYHGPDGDEATGSMPNKGAVAGTIGAVDDTYGIPAGYHNGGGTVSISPTEKAKLIPGNIPAGVTILGVVGIYKTPYSYQSKTATPAATAQTISPDAGYDGLSRVVVAAVPYAEAENTAGGITVTIG